MSEWQPIDTAPKDGTAILAFPCRIDDPAGNGLIDAPYVVIWRDWTQYGGDAGWHEAGGERYAMWEPTHWMLLPPGPKQNPPSPAGRASLKGAQG
jgi:hypothetical protein